MRPNPNRGRVYRRCACRNDDGKQLGTRCPKLANPRHGIWAFAVDRPAADSSRKTMRRSGFTTKAEASEALSKVLECERAGVLLDDTETVAQYLISWLDVRSPNLRPNTVLRYRDYINQDLIPAIGAVHLERLTHQHVRQRLERRRQATTTPPQPRTVRRPAPPAAQGAGMLDHSTSRRLPALLPPHERPELPLVTWRHRLKGLVTGDDGDTTKV
jgi:hypothetical protein